MDNRCKIHICSRYKENICCHYCKKRCIHSCLNSPDKCKVTTWKMVKSSWGLQEIRRWDEVYDAKELGLKSC